MVKIGQVFSEENIFPFKVYDIYLTTGNVKCTHDHWSWPGEVKITCYYDITRQENIFRVRVMVFNATFNNISVISW